MLSSLSNKKSFDACVIDFKLPDGSGLDIAEVIRLKWGATPIILISGYDPAAPILLKPSFTANGDRES
jgi:DNA-binding response OmpR family regulator